MGKLIEKLTEYSRGKVYPFHMPGHKRRFDCEFNPYKFDITEINGFDDLGEPEEILLDLQERVAGVYKCRKAFILVNGSTSGVLAGISAALKSGESVLMARNSHKSAYNAAFIRHLNVEYLFPETDNELGISMQISPEIVEKYLKNNPDIKAVFITSPTYEGIISDIGSISRVVHRHGAVLIVDCAHGAHLGILEDCGSNPVSQGADITIMSLHKTLPAPTQTAVLCVNGNLIDDRIVKKYINIYNSSSPSYLLMAGIEKCIDLIESSGDILFSEYYNNLADFRIKCRELEHLKLFSPQCEYDIGKIIISTHDCNINGRELSDILRQKYNIETEMSSCNYVLAMTSCMDSKEGFDMLYNSLKEIDESLVYLRKSAVDILFLSEKEFEMHDIEKYKILLSDIEESVGKICCDYIYLYPPGVPWIVPGEKITVEILEKIKHYLDNGFNIRGIRNNKIPIIER